MNTNDWYERDRDYEGYYQADEREQKSKKSILPQLLICLLSVALLSGSLGAAIGGAFRKDADKRLEPQQEVLISRESPGISAQSLSTTPIVSFNGGASSGFVFSENNGQNNESETTRMLQSCIASIVGITIEQTGNYYGQTITQQVSSGSGIIFTADGYIVTNHHVIADTNGIIKVCMQDGSEYEASIVGMDEKTDIGILKIDAEGLHPVTIGDSKNTLVGQTVYAIGNPLGEFLCSVSSGIISGLNRSVEIDGITMTLMQTDAAVNPGNSGGGFFNSSGELIGIINAKTSSLSVEGIGFAIPIDSVLGVISDLMDLGYVSGRPYLGLDFQDVYMRSSNNNFGGYFGSVYYYQTRVQILEVAKNSPAEAAGVLPNDIIIAFDGKEIHSISELTSLLYDYEIGDKVQLRVLRGSEYVDLEIKLGSRDS